MCLNTVEALAYLAVPSHPVAAEGNVRVASVLHHGIRSWQLAPKYKLTVAHGLF